MPITFQWYDDEKTIMLQTYTPSWTWKDYVDVAVETLTEVGTVDHPVITIADFTQMDLLPFNSSVVKDIMKGINGYPPNWQGTVVVTNKRIVQTIAKFFQHSAQHLKYEVYLEDTFEDALKRIEKIRSEM